MAQVMNEYEQQLDEALFELETADVSQESRDVIRAACGKPYTKKDPNIEFLANMFADMGTAFGATVARNLK